MSKSFHVRTGNQHIEVYELDGEFNLEITDIDGQAGLLIKNKDSIEDMLITILKVGTRIAEEFRR